MSSHDVPPVARPSGAPPPSPVADPAPIARPGAVFVPFPAGFAGPVPEPRTPTSPDVIIESPSSRTAARLTTGHGWAGDAELLAGRNDTFVVRGGSVRGTSHRGNGTVRQDSFCAVHHPGAEAVVLAVADGVSAGSRSEVGSFHFARAAVAAANRLLDRNPDTTAEELAATLCDVAVEGDRCCHADVPELDAKEFAATLIVAVVDQSSVRVARVGDCAAWILRGDGTWMPAEGDTGAVPGVRDNRTEAMPMHADRARPATVTLGPGDVCVAMTDGLCDPMGNGFSPTGEYLAERWSTPPDLFRFGIDLSFEAATYADDRTAVAVWRVQP